METNQNKLVAIQQKLKVPKNNLNNFGGYKYRSCEDIIEAAKPLCGELGLTLHLSDEVIQVGNRIYVKATACIKDNGNTLDCATGYAREEETKKGMDASQITGAASSYARKYALNGLLGIDDAKDADSNEHHHENGHSESPAPVKKQAPQPTEEKKSYSGKEDNRPWLTEKMWRQALDKINGGSIDVYQKTIDAFRMKRDWRKGLDEAFEFSKNTAR
jgi:ERF superfamily